MPKLTAAEMYAQKLDESRVKKLQLEDAVAKIRPPGSALVLTNREGSRHFRTFTGYGKFGERDMMIAAELDLKVYKMLVRDIKDNVKDPRIKAYNMDIFSAARLHYSKYSVETIGGPGGKRRVERPGLVGKLGLVHLDTCGTALTLATSQSFIEGLKWMRYCSFMHSTWMMDVSFTSRRGGDHQEKLLDDLIKVVLEESDKFRDQRVKIVGRETYNDSIGMVNKQYLIERGVPNQPRSIGEFPCTN